MNLLPEEYWQQLMANYVVNYLRKRTPGRTPETANPCELCLDSCANYVLNPNTSKRTVVMSQDIVPNEPPDG